MAKRFFFTGAASFALLLLLPLAAAGAHRLRALVGQNEALLSTATCNMTALSTHLNELAAKPECSQAWPAFQARLTDVAAAQTSFEDNVQALADLCKSSCGPLFDAAAADWRGWCETNRDSFVPNQRTSMWATFLNFAAPLGCSMAADRFCAAGLVMMQYSRNHDGCTFATSCCMGEVARFTALTDDGIAANDKECPGLRAAVNSTCKA